MKKRPTIESLVKTNWGGSLKIINEIAKERGVLIAIKGNDIMAAKESQDFFLGKVEHIPSAVFFSKLYPE
jgi:hypothetical protein